MAQLFCPTAAVTITITQDGITRSFQGTASQVLIDQTHLTEPVKDVGCLHDMMYRGQETTVTVKFHNVDVSYPTTAKPKAAKKASRKILYT